MEYTTKLFKARNPFHRIPLTWYSPGEEDVAMTGMLCAASSIWGYLFPQQLNRYLENYVLFNNISPAEEINWKKTYRTLLKKLSLANGGKQLVLKNPPNTARIKMLLSLFPNAKFVFICRDPYEVYASNKKMLEMARKNYILGKTDSVDFNNIIIQTYSKISGRYLEDKNLIPAGRLAELRYENLIEEPVESLRQIYQTLNLADFGYCEKKVADFAGRQKNYKTLNHTLPENEILNISENWAPFLRHWNYPSKILPL